MVDRVVIESQNAANSQNIAANSFLSSSDALATSSDALVTSSFLLLSQFADRLHDVSTKVECLDPPCPDCICFSADPSLFASTPYT